MYNSSNRSRLVELSLDGIRECLNADCLGVMTLEYLSEFEHGLVLGKLNEPMRHCARLVTSPLVIEAARGIVHTCAGQR